MTFTMPLFVRRILCILGIHLKYKWSLGTLKCLCGEVEWHD